MIDSTTYFTIFMIIYWFGAVLSCTVYLNYSLTTKICILLACVVLGFTICFAVYMLFGGGANDMISILPINKTAFYQSELVKNNAMFNGK